MVRGRDVHWVVGRDLRSVSGRLARHVAASARRAVAARGRFRLVLSGGSTPRTLYALLATRGALRMPWARTEVYWGDERLVPPADPESNYGMARDALLDRVKLPPASIHRIRGELRPMARAAQDYERTLRPLLHGPGPAFDLVLLGMGPDGHTASLYPRAPALKERARPVRSVPRAGAPPYRPRVTLTLPALRSTRETCFLICGAEKAGILRAAYGTLPAGSPRYPASLLLQGPGTSVYVDRAAAAGLPLARRRARRARG